MSEFEDELHDRLSARADAVHVDTDWDDLVTRMTRRARRTNSALAVALVLTLCASSVAVVVAARGGGESAPKAKAAPAARGRVEATHAAVPLVSLASGPTYATLTGGAAGAAGPSAVLTAPAVPGGLYAISRGGWLIAGSPGDLDMARVFTRTTASGITIRAYRANISPQSSVQGPPWWTQPAWCSANAYMQADVSDAAVADVGFAPLYSAQPDGSTVSGSVTAIGIREKAYRWIVIGQGPANAALLRATFPDGSHDEMAPVDGAAVLAGHGTADAKGSVQLAALDASGATIGTTSLSIDGVGVIINAKSVDKRCMAPQSLPAPGAQQPADVAAARQAVTDVFDHAYATGIDDATRFAGFDDSHGFADVLRKLRTGSFKKQVESATFKLNDVVFLSPTVAAIQYEIDVPGYGTPSFAPRFNEARLVDGKWKLARAGFCHDTELAAVSCPS